MKLFAKLSALGVVLVMTASFASADTVQLGSYGTGSGNMGNQNSALVFAGSPSTTYNIGDSGVWAPAAANSSWVSQSPANCPSCSNTYEPNGIYTFSTTFNLADANYSGSIYVMADDTTDVYLNGNLLQGFSTSGNTKCQDTQPNCITPLLVNLPGADF